MMVNSGSDSGPESVSGHGNLIAKVTGGGEVSLMGDGESIWIDVIHKMDAVYADLIRYEADLESKNMELEEAQTFISSVIASVSDILVVVDRRGLILQVNPAFVKLVGKSEVDLLKSSIGEWIADADRAPALSQLLTDWDTPDRTLEMRFATDRGPSDLMAVNCSARLNHSGRRVGVVLTGRPIGELRRAYEALHAAHTDLQRAQRKLVEQEKMASLGRLVAGVAHELNNPISFVYGNVHTLDRYRNNLAAYLAALHDGDPNSAQLRKSLKIDSVMADLPPLLEGTLEGVARVAEIVRNLRLLSFSKTGEAQTFDVEKVIRTASQWASRSKKFPAEMILDLEPGVMATGNEGQIHQVMVNLIDNALDAAKSAPEPKVTVTLRAQEGEPIITVADNGPGVSADVRDKIYEPFFTTKEVGEGTGLGLWISYTIVHEHSGSITLGTSPSGGAQFTVTLPQ